MWMNSLGRPRGTSLDDVSVSGNCGTQSLPPPPRRRNNMHTASSVIWSIDDSAVQDKTHNRASRHPHQSYPISTNHWKVPQSVSHHHHQLQFLPGAQIPHTQQQPHAAYFCQPQQSLPPTIGNDGQGYYSAHAVAARAAIHAHFEEEHSMREDVKKERRRLRKMKHQQKKVDKARRRAQKKQDKLELQQSKECLIKEFEERKQERQRERERRRLEKEFGTDAADQILSMREQNERRRTRHQREDGSSGGGDENVDDANFDSDSDSDNSVTTENSDDIRAREEERVNQIAMAKAAHGKFVGDVKIMCCSNLPKVDGFFSGGSIDPYVRILFDGAEIDRTEHKMRQQRPRFDHHTKINFEGSEDSGTPSEDAVLRLEVWDWDRIGKDDLISFVELDSIDARKYCCATSSNRPLRFQLRPNERASFSLKKKYGVGEITLQFGLPENIDYEAEAEKSRRMGGKMERKRKERIAKARLDYAVRG